MKNLTRAEAAGFLLAHDNFCIMSHRNPDGDAVGSSAALCLGLRKLGKKAWVLTHPEITDRFSWLVEDLSLNEPEADATMVTVDVATADRLPRAFAPWQDRVQLRIDHHASGEAYAAEELVDGASASCAELIWDVLNLLGVEMDQELANAVYVGLSSDTGCFRYANTTPHSFLTAALCSQAGAQIGRINQELFETNTLSKLRMHAWIIENLHIFGNGKLATVAIPRAVEDLLGVTDDDMDNISSFPRSVKGVCMAATLRQSKYGETKISVRAIPGYDAAKVCACFGGGGHTGAAGATTRISLEEARKQLEERMLEEAP